MFSIFKSCNNSFFTCSIFFIWFIVEEFFSLLLLCNKSGFFGNCLTLPPPPPRKIKRSIPKGREGRERGKFVLRPRSFSIFKMADETENVSKPKYPSNPTLFPILRSENTSAATSYGLLFPCASSKVKEPAANVDKGKSIRAYKTRYQTKRSEHSS